MRTNHGRLMKKVKTGEIGNILLGVGGRRMRLAVFSVAVEPLIQIADPLL